MISYLFLLFIILFEIEISHLFGTFVSCRENLKIDPSYKIIEDSSFHS